jgi:ribose transport system ATP-binding protein
MSLPSLPPLLEVRDIRKQFPGVLALDNVSLEVYPGEILALIGENGAGKSTLMKILGGVHTPDAGEIRVDGCPVAIDSVSAAMRHGIALIHQELNLADNLDVGANVFLGREPVTGGPLRLIDKRRIARDTTKVLQRLGMNLEPQRIVGTLPMGQQQMVEIAKALSFNARLLILDEPTSSLTQKETDALFAILRELKSQGVSMIYISHRLGEISELCDRVVAMRDGRNSGGLARGEIDRARMVKLMVGREVGQFYRRAHAPIGETVLELRNVRTAAHPRHEVSFSLRAGEILGLAGLVGAGRTELAETLFGIAPARGGQILIGGRPARIASPRDAIAAGLALVPEDRKQQGLVLEMSNRANISLAGLGRPALQGGGFIRGGAEKALAEKMVREMNVKTPGIEQLVGNLSGGNQQKVVLGKWLALGPRVLILDEPTRGIDVVAKEEIYRLMERLTEAGMAIMMISSELQEIIGISSRVLVMHEGRLAGELDDPAMFTEEAIMHLATGGAGRERKDAEMKVGV